MIGPLERLALRRAALVRRSTEQREALVTAAHGIRELSALPAIVGAGAAAGLLAWSPALRAWALRGWAAYTVIRRLLAA